MAILNITAEIFSLTHPGLVTPKGVDELDQETHEETSWQHMKHLNSLRPRRNEQHFADDIFKHIFFNENVWILIKISLKFVPKGPINNIPALVQVMAWRRPGDKPLSEAMVVRLLTHICVTRPQWVKLNMVTWRLEIKMIDQLKNKAFRERRHPSAPRSVTE